MYGKFKTLKIKAVTNTGIAQLSGVYVPFPYIAPILCALLCENEMDNFMCLLEYLNVLKL